MAEATSGRAPEVRIKRLGMLAMALCAAAPAAAQQVERAQPVELAQQDSGRVHVVRRGDTLWDLSRLYLSNPYLWPEIHRLNQQAVQNPHWIFPRARLRIPGAGGPMDPTAVADGALPDGALPEEGLAPGAQPGQTVFFGDNGSQMARARVREVAAQAVPVVAPGDYYGAGLLVPTTEMRPVGRLAEPLAPTVVEMEIPPMIAPYDLVYLVLASPDAVRPGERLHLFRVERRVRPYGQVHVPTAISEVVSVDGQVATVRIEEVFDAVDPGNVAVPVSDFQPVLDVTPQPASGPVGRIVAFQSPQPVHSVRDVAFVNLGRSEGLTEGDELLAVLPPRGRGTKYRPEIVVARLQVVRVTERTAAARVVELEHPALEPGLAVRLVSRMP